MGRGINWTSIDDVEMCRSWLHISQDSRVGTNQKLAHLWEKIMAHWQTKWKEGDPKRTMRAAQSRWGQINNATSKFVAAHVQAERSAPSGTNTSDLERRAMEIYRLDTTNGGKSFEFRECWLILKDSPKWASPLAGQVAQGESAAPTPTGSSPGRQQPQTPTAPHSSNSVLPRPVGAKRAKADIQQGKLHDRAVKAVESANILAIKRQRIMHQQLALGYFKTQDNDVPLELREMFNATRLGILKDLTEATAAAPSAPQPPSPESDGLASTPSSGHARVDLDIDMTDGDLHDYNAHQVVGEHTAYNPEDEDLYVVEEDFQRDEGTGTSYTEQLFF